MAGLFGAPRRLPQLDPALAGMMAQEAGLQQPLPQPAPQPQKKPGFFGAGGPARGIAGTVGDFLLQYNGMQPIYGPTQQRAQEMAEALRAKSLEREAGWQDWLRKQQWERDNPSPANNDTERDYAFIAQTLGEDAAKQYLRNLGDPIVTVQLPGNRVYSGPRSGMAQALGGAAPTKPVGKLTPLDGGPGGSPSGAGFR